MAKIYTLCRDP